MKPLEILRRYQGDVSLIDECVLEQICLFGKPVTVQTIVTTCGAENIASPATIHKSIVNLYERGLLKQHINKDDPDNRKRWIIATESGRRRIKGMQ